MSTQAATEAGLSEAPIHRRKLSREVLDRLLARIRSGEWAEGSQLPSERQLMDAFGVGRPAIREAMQSLERMGLISISHGERARVRPVSAQAVIAQVAEVGHHLLASSPQSLEHLKEARLFFEVGMVRIAARRATQDDIGHLRMALDAQRAAAPDEFLQRDMEFHRAIAAVSANPIYIALSQAVFNWLETFHVDLVRAPGAERVTLLEHERILRAIAAHDEDAAERAMSAHLTRASKLYRALQQPKAGAPVRKRRPPRR